MHPFIEKTKAYVQKTLANAEGGHDWWHIQRVHKTASKIGQQEAADMLVVELAALLHDIADSKFHNGDEEIGPKKAETFLNSIQVPEETIKHVVNIVRNISFKGGNFSSDFSSLELDILRDADRLDAMGAIGIARAFNYGGFKNRALYDPAVPPKLNMTKEEYKKSTAPTINHFYEKLLLLKDRMNTDHGKKLAQHRHDFMLRYLDEFFAEWGDEDSSPLKG